MKKLVSALVLNYKVSGHRLSRVSFRCVVRIQTDEFLQFHLLDPDAFTVENSWFFRQRGLNVSIQRRASGETG